MKVCTDSCLFGAWLNQCISADNTNPAYALDIGTGTGLLSLMIAQGNPKLTIDALEMEENAFKQAAENVSTSIFSEQIQIHHTSLQSFRNEKEYDLIFSNPPFFENDLPSLNHQKNMAKHDTSLTLGVLIDFIQQHLSLTGSAAVLIPHQRSGYLTELITHAGLIINQIVHVKQTPKHAFFRTMLLLSRNAAANLATTEITIKDSENEYTKAFSALLQPYYLNM